MLRQLAPLASPEVSVSKEKASTACHFRLVEVSTFSSFVLQKYSFVDEKCIAFHSTEKGFSTQNFCFTFGLS